MVAMIISLLEAGGHGQTSNNAVFYLLCVLRRIVWLAFLPQHDFTLRNLEAIGPLQSCHQIAEVFIRMPSRTPSHPSGHFQRSKSFSSMQTQHLRHAKSFNTSELAHREALMAAEFAFQRAHERHADEDDRDLDDTQHTPYVALRSEDLGPTRRQSIRYTGSNAVKTRALPHTRREVLSHQNPLDQGRLALRSEYAETLISSEPSSYRKLRKAKSMFAYSKPTSFDPLEDTHMSRPHPKRDSVRLSDGHNSPTSLPDRRLRRSFSFLRGVTDRISITNQHFPTNDAANEMSRDEKFRYAEGQTTNEQPRLSKLAGKRRSHRDFRHTVRTVGTKSFGLAVEAQSNHAKSPRIRSHGHKARSISQALTWALKKVLRRPLTHDQQLPEQHLSATRTHYGETPNENVGDYHFSPVPSPDIELLRRIGSRGTLIRNVPDYNGLAAHDSKPFGLDMEDNSSNQQSRVTSWTDSMGESTVNIPYFNDRKRLSVIKEDGGPHQSSRSAKPLVDPAGGYAAFQQPVRSAIVGPIPAQRVYSALQKKILRGEEVTAQDHDDLQSDISAEDERTVREMSHLGRAQRVPSDRPGIGHGLTEGYQILDIPIEAQKSIASVQIANDEICFSPEERLFGPLGHEHEYVGPSNRLTPQQIAHLNEPELPAAEKLLGKARTSIFPKALRRDRHTTDMEKPGDPENKLNTDGKEDTDGDIRTNIWMPTPYSMVSIRNHSTAMSESAYSRTEGGHSPKARGSSMSLSKSDSSGEPATAVIITGGIQSSEPSRLATSRRSPVSNVSSVERMGWKSPEAPEFKNRSSGHDSIHTALPVKESGHKREHAQWDGEEVAIHNPYQLPSSSIQPLGNLQAKNEGRPALQQRMSWSNIRRMPSHNVNAALREGKIAQKENATKKRATTDALNKFWTPGAGKLDEIPARSTKVNLNPRSENESPTSAKGRNSPERAERLRRLRNRSSLSLSKPKTSPKAGSTDDKSEMSLIQVAANVGGSGQAEHFVCAPNIQIVGGEAMVNGFLKSRRSRMRFSDDSVDDPAFL